MKQFLIGAAASNSGKTTLTMGLLRALRDRGLRVQPFKCGPDYIDTMFHHLASGNESINLDSFFASHGHLQDLFHRHSMQADVSVVEGVMGLFDGYEKTQGSSAEIAKILGLPIVLVINAKSTAYSVAPLIYGYKTFDPQLHIAGVIFNQVGSDKHYHLLQQACADAGVECLGYLARNPQLIIPGRHLGLTISERQEMDNLITLAAKEVEQHVDIEKLIAL